MTHTDPIPPPGPNQTASGILRMPPGIIKGLFSETIDALVAGRFSEAIEPRRRLEESGVEVRFQLRLKPCDGSGGPA